MTNRVTYYRIPVRPVCPKNGVFCHKSTNFWQKTTDHRPIFKKGLDSTICPTTFSTAPLLVTAPKRCLGQGEAVMILDGSPLVQDFKDQPRRAEQVLGRADWDFLLLERVCIMEESGIPAKSAFALAQADTTSIYGPRPGESA